MKLLLTNDDGISAKGLFALAKELEKDNEVKGDLNSSFDENTDKSFIKDGYVTITPLHYDLTNYKILKEVNDIFGVD